MFLESNGQIPEWPNGADCKSAGLRLRWFESIFAHPICGSSSVDRALAFQAEGRGFESRLPLTKESLARLSFFVPIRQQEESWSCKANTSKQHLPHPSQSPRTPHAYAIGTKRARSLHGARSKQTPDTHAARCRQTPHPHHGTTAPASPHPNADCRSSTSAPPTHFHRTEEQTRIKSQKHTGQNT